MKVEYLIVTQQDGCFCNNETAFNSLLQADTQIVIQDKKLIFTQGKQKIEADYGLETDEIKDKKQRYFHIKLAADDDSQIELFTSLVRTIKKIVERLNSNISINALWDDISRHYIIQAYPLINEVENVMRKLILKFMLVNVGMDWADEKITTELKTKISNKAELNNAKAFREDTLHNADFIQLSSILFDKKRDKDINQLDSLISKKKKNETVTFGELSKDFSPVSNWDRYFSNLINYEGKLLEEKWAELYDLRNKIAHNKSFSKAELEKVEKLHNEIIEKLNEAIKELDKVELDEQQKQKIVDSYQNSPQNDSSNRLISNATLFFYGDDSSNRAIKAQNFLVDNALIYKAGESIEYKEGGFYFIKITFKEPTPLYLLNTILDALNSVNFHVDSWTYS